MRGAKDVYQVTGNSKDQVTTLCAISAAGTVVPPMHIFAGKRLRLIQWKAVYLMHVLVNSIKDGLTPSLLQVARRAFHKTDGGNQATSVIN